MKHYYLNSEEGSTDVTLKDYSEYMKVKWMPKGPSQIIYCKYNVLIQQSNHIIYTVISMLAFLYQLSNGFSPLLVSVSSMYAHRWTKSSWLMTWDNFPVLAR